MTDTHQALDEADVVAGVLVARLAEPVHRCQEVQLHALAELAEWHDLRPELVNRLSRIARPVADPLQDQYLDGLLPLDGSRAHMPMSRARSAVTDEGHGP